MRRIIICITEVPERKEIETSVEAEETATSTQLEDRYAEKWLPTIIAAISTGAKIVALGAPGQELDELRIQARTAYGIDQDIRKAGES